MDRRLAGSTVPLTRPMNLEHQIMRRWIDEMARLADGSMPDHHAFTRRGERLPGLIEAHFEVDETILYPVLDEALPLIAGRK